MKSPGILIVQKEAIVAMDVERQLRSFGYRPLGVALSGEEAIQKSLDLQPDLILMDNDLNGLISGLDAAGTIMDNQGIPVVLITSFLEDISREGGGSFFPFGYIVKPFESRELKVTLDAALHRHEMEDKLQISEERYRSFFEEDLSGIFLTDGEGRIQLCNSAFARMFEFDSPREAQGYKIATLFPSREVWENFYRELEERGRIRLAERELISLRGTPLLALGNYLARFSARGDINEIIGYLHDTTEKKRLEEMLTQSQKMEAVGRLSGGIAHDFNNVLTIILGYSAMIKEKLEDGEPVDQDILGIEEAAGKAATLTRQLLTFSRRQVLKPKYINLNQVVRDLEKMLRRLIGEQVVMHVYPHAEEPTVFADPGKLEQVLLNLAVNARDAMPGGGRITIEIINRRVEVSEPSVMGRLDRGEYVMLSLRDNGMGIPEDIQDKIFEPFYTTKPASQGTGLGLSSVYGILKQSGAHIQLESLVGQGTTFRIYFPISEKPAGEGPGVLKQSRDLPKGKGEMILLVEDDEQVRKVLYRQLSKGGYQVIVAENAGEALMLCESNREIRLLLTDLMMPHVGGGKLVSRLRREAPGIKAVVMSGHPEKLESRKDEGLEGVPVICKPVDPGELFRTLREQLTSRASEGSDSS